MTAPDLKPCPFCGGTDLEIREMGEEWHVVSCNGCNAEGGYYLPDDSTMPEEAAELWNRRATPLAEARRYMGQIMAECDCSRQGECEAAQRCLAVAAPDIEIPADAENGRATVSRITKGDVSQSSAD